jgi:hypothetical protein
VFLAFWPYDIWSKLIKINISGYWCARHLRQLRITPEVHRAAQWAICGLGYELLNCHGRLVNPFENCRCRFFMLDGVYGHRNFGSLAVFAARGCGMAIQVTPRFFRLWLVLSLLWIAVVAFGTWRDIPRDDWVRPDLSQQNDDVIEAPVGMFHPVAVLVIERGVKLAFIPPVVVLACGVCLWAFRRIRERAIVGHQTGK